jgi:hypothetical protein
MMNAMYPRRDRSPERAIAAAVALVAVFAGARAAEDPASLSFAFASQAGSGIYDIEGRFVQIYRIPIEFTVKPLIEERRWGAAVLLPITFGFYDYKASDALSGEFPTHVGTASLVPGVRFDVRAKPNWVLSPYVDLGAAKDFSGGSLVWVYDVGLKSVVSFPAGSWDGRAGQELLWAGAAQTSDPLTAWFGEADVGFEFRHELPWNLGKSRADVGIFAVYRRYFRHSESFESASPIATFSAEPATVPGVNEQTEVGFSFGTRPKLAWWKLSMPKLGLSYRFGDGIGAIRIIFGEIF